MYSVTAISNLPLGPLRLSSSYIVDDCKFLGAFFLHRQRQFWTPFQVDTERYRSLGILPVKLPPFNSLSLHILPRFPSRKAKAGSHAPILQVLGENIAGILLKGSIGIVVSIKQSRVVTGAILVEELNGAVIREPGITLVSVAPVVAGSGSSRVRQVVFLSLNVRDVSMMRPPKLADGNDSVPNAKLGSRGRQEIEV